MKYYLLLCVSLVAFSSSIYAQSYKDQYQEKLEPNSKFLRGTGNSTLEKTKEGTYIYKKYYPENKMITQLMTSDMRNFEVLNGLYYTAYDDGIIVTKGNYVNNLKEGYWVEGVSRSGYYKNGNKEATWKQVINDTMILYEENYISGKLEGTATKYDSLGNVQYQMAYRDGDLLTTTKDTTIKIVEEMPRFSGCEELGLDKDSLSQCATKKLLEYVYSNIRYPDKAREYEVEGKAIIQFVIDKSGDVTDIKVLNGISKEIKNECLRLLRNMPKWIPGIQDGVPVKVSFTLPIQFKLQ
jgi:TonB family protein